MPFIVNVPVNFSSYKIFSYRNGTFNVSTASKKCLVFIDYILLLEYLLNAFMMLKM